MARQGRGRYGHSLDRPCDSEEDRRRGMEGRRHLRRIRARTSRRLCAVPRQRRSALLLLPHRFHARTSCTTREGARVGRGLRDLARRNETRRKKRRHIRAEGIWPNRSCRRRVPYLPSSREEMDSSPLSRRRRFQVRRKVGETKARGDHEEGRPQEAPCSSQGGGLHHR